MIDKPIACFLILSFFFLQKTSTQTPSADSLQNVLNAYPLSGKLQAADTAYLFAAITLCGKYFDEFELDSMRTISTKALDVSQRILDNTNNPYLKSRLDLYKMQFFRTRGISYHQNGEYVKALEDFQQYLTQAEKIGSKKDIGSGYTNIAFCHRELEDYKLAYDFARKSVEILKNTPYKGTLANNYSVFSSYYSQVKMDLDSAIVFVKMARQIYKEVKNPFNEANSIMDVAELFSEKFQPDSVIFYLKQVAPFVFQQQSPDMLSRYHAKMGEALFAKGNARQGLEHLNTAYEAAKDLGSPAFQYNIEKLRCLALAAQNKPIEALKSMNATFDAYTEDINTDNARQITTTQLNFDFQKKEALAAVELERQKRIKYLSIGGFIMGVVFALMLFRLYRLSKKAAKILAEKNAQIEKSYRELKETQEQLVLTEKQREAQSVRVRIARDIHDELGAGLTKITMLCDLVRRQLPAEQHEMAQMLQRIAENSKGVSSTLSEIIWAVNPTYDTLDSLSNYLKNYAAHYLDNTGINAEFNFPAELPQVRVEPELKRNIFLVLKEALNNAVKYAQATTIWITFSADANSFHLSIRDNGIGFNANGDAPHDGAGNGLHNMKTRMEHLRCAFELRTQPGQGCTVEAHGVLSDYNTISYAKD